MTKKIHINNDDNYATPPDFYDALNKRFGFDFDPCPYNEGPILTDGLKIEWGGGKFCESALQSNTKRGVHKKGYPGNEKGKGLCVSNTCIDINKTVSRTHKTKRNFN